MKKLLFLGLTISICLTIFSQEKTILVKELTENLLPKELKFKGECIEAKNWSDINGENILLISRLGPYTAPSKAINGALASNIELFAYQFLLAGSKPVLLWEFSDSVKNCHVDMFMGLLPNSTIITDLNKNGLTETTIIYRKSCRGDVSPSDMSILIFEGKKLYRLKGQMYSRDALGKPDESFQCDLSKSDLEKYNKKTFEYFKAQIGRYENENEFTDAPDVFLSFARKKWREFFIMDDFQTVK